LEREGTADHTALPLLRCIKKQEESTMRLERIAVEGLTEYWLLDDDGNAVEEVFIPTGEENERDMWLAGYRRIEDKYDEIIEGLRPSESWWVLDPEGSPISKVYSYCKNCGRLFSDEQLKAVLQEADNQRGPLFEEDLARLSLFCPDYDSERGCGTRTEGIPKWEMGPR
jgi:hypothetical protein